MEKTENKKSIPFDEHGNRLCSSCLNVRTDFHNNNVCCDRCIGYGKALYKKRKEFLQQVIVCECGCTIRKFSTPQHVKSKKHALMLKQKELVNTLLALQKEHGDKQVVST